MREHIGRGDRQRGQRVEQRPDEHVSRAGADAPSPPRNRESAARVPRLGLSL
jgi:hypothetical protein